MVAKTPRRASRSVAAVPGSPLLAEYTVGRLNLPIPITPAMTSATSQAWVSHPGLVTLHEDRRGTVPEQRRIGRVDMHVRGVAGH